MKKTIAYLIVALMTVSTAMAYTTTVSSSAPAAQKKEKKAKKELKEVTWHLHLHCEDCVNKILENISFERGVKDLKVTLEENSIYIKYDPSRTSEEKLAAALKSLGYEVFAPGEHVHSHEGHSHDGHEGHDHDGHDHNHDHNHKH